MKGPATKGPFVVAIDGPAGSGKSTLARNLAGALGVPSLDTGAMYRAAAAAVLAKGVVVNEEGEVSSVVAGSAIDVGERVLLDGKDVTELIRTPEVEALVSDVAALPEVRRDLVGRQQQWIRAHGGGVVEGRDIGTVVAPDAVLKVFLVAEPRVRATRRAGERRQVHALSDVEGEIARRDRIDSSRATDPMRSAEALTAIGTDPSVMVVDTTSVTSEDVLAVVLERLTDLGVIARR